MNAQDTTAADATRRRVGLGLGLLALFMFASQDAITRALVQDLPVPQILTIRFVGFATFALIFAAWRLGPRKAFKTGHPVLQVTRSALLLIEIAIFSFALRTLELADMHAIFAMFPLVVTALAGPMLGEHVGWRRWVAVGIGFIGTLIIVRPGFSVFQPTMMLGILAAVMWAFYNILTRKVSRTDASETSLLYTGLVAVALITPFGIAAWIPPAPDLWPLLLLLVAISTTSHLFLILALARIEASEFQPFNYMLLVFATLTGFVFFNEFPDFWTIVGAVVVVGSGLYVILREHQLARSKIVERPLPRRVG